MRVYRCDVILDLPNDVLHHIHSFLAYGVHRHQRPRASVPS